MPAIDYRRARAELPLAEVLTLIGYTPPSCAGVQLRGPCPLHGSRSKASRVFAAHLGRNLYHCFRCGAGGNALDLWAALRRWIGARDGTSLCRGWMRPNRAAAAERPPTAYGEISDA
jgi:CHC2 zinc finger